jgi:hypothetical protein
LEKSVCVQPRLSSAWHTGLSSGGCARPAPANWPLSGKLRWRTAIIYRTIRWCTRLPGEPTAVSTTSAAKSAGDAWPAPTVGRGHRTVRCAPDSVRCANCHKSTTVGCTRLGRESHIGHEQWLSGAPPDRRQD